MQASLTPWRRQSGVTKATTRGSAGRHASGTVRFVRHAVLTAPVWMRHTLLLCILALVATAGLGVVQAQGKVTNGLIIGGAHVGGMSYDEARRTLDERVAAFNQQTVMLTFGDSSWTPTLEELGITADAETAWSQILEHSSGAPSLERLLRFLQIRASPTDLAMPLLIKPVALQVYCADRMTELGLAPVDAELRIDGQSLVVTQDASGYVVSIDQLRADLIRELRGFTAPTINLAATFSRASVKAASLEPDLAVLRESLDQPLVLMTDTDQWEVPPGQLAQHFTIDSTSGEPSIMMDERAISDLVDQVAADLEHPVIDAGLDTSGLFDRISVANDGVMVNRPELKQRIHDAISNGYHEVEIPLIVVPAATNTDDLLREYGVTELIATGSSDFGGSEAGRDKNVRLAATMIDGTLVPPGHTFSFLQALGPITEELGYVPAGASEGGIPGTSVGGGVCQVSTSLFRSVLEAGLPITEWWPHAYRSVFYEQDGWTPGFDASVQQDESNPLHGADFRFKNTTDGYILIRVEATTKAELKVSLFGTPTGYDVVISNPIYDAIVPADSTPIEEIDDTLESGTVVLWQPARDGVTMIVHRTVYAADGSIISDEDFISMYQPQGPIYRVSTDMAGSSLSAA